MTLFPIGAEILPRRIDGVTAPEAVDRYCICLQRPRVNLKLGRCLARVGLSGRSYRPGLYFAGFIESWPPMNDELG